MPPSTSGRCVDAASGAIRRTTSSPARMSTPAARYVRGSITPYESNSLSCASSSDSKPTWYWPVKHAWQK